MERNLFIAVFLLIGMVESQYFTQNESYRHYDMVEPADKITEQLDCLN